MLSFTRHLLRLTTQSGLEFTVRQACPDDEPALASFFEHVTEEDRRFRYLSSVKISHAQLVALTVVDPRVTVSLVGIGDDGQIIATAMLACDASGKVGEAAISVSAEFKNQGIGWELLRHLSSLAQSRGVTSLQCLENRANKSAIQIEREFGFVASPYPGDSGLVVLQKNLAP